jgi:triosephosphate isomerase
MEWTQDMKKLIAGNWKMNMNAESAKAFNQAMAQVDESIVEWLVCPPYLYIQHITNTKRGAQDCSAFESGAHTGDISASMLMDAGCDYCIVGHSERRVEPYGETSDIVRHKAQMLMDNGMSAIICVGETLEEREEGKAHDIVEEQLLKSVPNGARPDNCVIAYEPVWAIGTGEAATSCDVSNMHNYIREILKTHVADGTEMRILYGGSVKPDNAAELLNIDNVDGALIGGASLKAEDFIAIGKAVES